MSDVRVSQVATEVGYIKASELQVSQVGFEVGYIQASELQVSQVAYEVGYVIGAVRTEYGPQAQFMY